MTREMYKWESEDTQRQLKEKERLLDLRLELLRTELAEDLLKSRTTLKRGKNK